MSHIGLNIGVGTYGTSGRSSRNSNLHHISAFNSIDTSSRNEFLRTLRTRQNLEQNRHRRVLETDIVHKVPGKFRVLNP